MGRPPKYSLEQVQLAALALVDEHGLESLSMRSLALALGTGAMTLYNHVRDRDALDRMVVDAVLGEAQWTGGHPDWRDDVRSIATAGWRAIRAHPNTIPLLLRQRVHSESMLRMSEALLEALARGNLPERRLLIAFRAVTALVMGAAHATQAPPAEVLRGEVQAFPQGHYPHLQRIAAASRQADVEAEFSGCLALVLSGLND